MFLVFVFALLTATCLTVTGLMASNQRGHVPRGKGRRAPALVAALVAVATDAGYLWIMFHQGDPVNVAVVTAVAGVIVLAALVVVVATLAIHGPSSRSLLFAAAFVLFALGVLGLMSIGLPLLCAGALTLASASSQPHSPRSSSSARSGT
jgi:cytochrome bd-type quinol oxidase subunit 2